MLEQNTVRLLKRNIRLFGIYKVFTKRVFLPVTTIYATQQAGLNIQQIGLIASLSSIVSLLCDTTTGYWADLHGRKRSAQVGSALSSLSSIIFVCSTNFYGILAASLVLAVGYSFLSGAMDALVHDSLVVLRRPEDYAKAASRAQSLSLVLNALFVATIPLLYPIDKRLPFALGAVAYMMLFSIASLLYEPSIQHDPVSEERHFLRTVRRILTKHTVWFFLLSGFVYAVGTGTSDVFNLAQIKIGVPIKYLGSIFAASSLLGAVLGIWVHHLKKLSFKAFATLDLCISLSPFVAYGIFQSLPIAVTVFVISFAFWRYEQILYQHYILKVYGTTRYKATILSLGINFRSLHEIWIAIASTSAAKHFGLLNGIGYSSIIILLALPLLLLSINHFSAYARADAAS